MYRTLMFIFAFLPGWMAQGAPVEFPTSAAQRPLLKSIYAGTHQLQEFHEPQTKAIVVVFLGTKCPVSQQYIPRLQAIHQEFPSPDVRMLGVFPDASIHLFEMATFAHDYNIPFPVFQDVEQRLADLLEVTTVPEVVVFDARWEKRYQGAIDDQFTKRGRRPEATRNYLSDALKRVVQGESVADPYMPPSGCPIERHRPSSTKQGVSFYKDVAPLIQKNCQSCHRTGGVAPFELLTYDEVAGNAEKIREVVLERRMPPWHGVLNPKFGEILNDKRLAPEELKTIVSWIDEGAIPGNVQDAPPAIQWPDPEAWAIGKPDFVYQIDKPFQVPKTGILDYQFFRVRLNYPEDRWFQAVEVRPGNPEVVHHIVLHVVPADNRQYTGLMGMAMLYGVNAEQGRMINDYIPGDTYNAKVYPSEQAVCIPKESDLIYEIHYTPNNREATTDQSQVAFRWAAQPPEEEVLASVFRKPIGRFRIPPHHPHYPIEDTYFFPHDILLDAVRPHFHLRGKSYRLEMIERDPETDEITNRTTIVSVPIYDPDWQRSYELAKPLFIPAGTELLATGHFDNSRLNPNNPNPAIEVEWGQQITDEMFSTRFKYRLANGNKGRETP